MDKITATSILNLWSNICIGSWEQSGEVVTLRTTEEDYTHSTIEEAAAAVLPTIAEWIKNIDK